LPYRARSAIFKAGVSKRKEEEMLKQCTFTREQVLEIAQTCRLPNGRLSYRALGHALGISGKQAKRIAAEADVPFRYGGHKHIELADVIWIARSCRRQDGTIKAKALGDKLSISARRAKRLATQAGLPVRKVGADRQKYEQAAERLSDQEATISSFSLAGKAGVSDRASQDYLVTHKDLRKKWGAMHARRAAAYARVRHAILILKAAGRKRKIGVIAEEAGVNPRTVWVLFKAFPELKALKN
jgi:hypothetical protein